MAMETYSRQTFKFYTKGVQCRPVNLLDEGKSPYLLNVTSVIPGSTQTRYGYTPFSATNGSPVHTLRRVNNIQDASETYARFAGAGTNLYFGQTSLSLLDTGYSGNPLSLVPYRPLQSPETWLYVGDTDQMKKYTLDGANKFNVGILPPANTPATEIGNPFRVTVDDFESTSGWTAGGAAGAPTSQSRVPASTTIQYILYENGTAGWANVSFTNPTSDYAFLTQGAALIFNGVETAVIQQVFTSLTSTTIASIIYDIGSVGRCTIVMATPVNGLLRNQFLRIGTENVRVFSVLQGADGLYSFRCSTVNTHTVGEAIVFLVSARVYFVQTPPYAPGQSVTGNDVGFTITVPGGNFNAIGYIDKSVSLDLTQSAGVPFSLQDYLHISVRVDNPANLIEGRVYLDIDSTNNDFAHNARYATFRASDFSQNASGTSTTVSSRSTSIQNQQIDLSDINPYGTATGVTTNTQGTVPLASQYNNPVSAQTNIGTQAWTEFYIPLTQLIPIGSDATRTLNTVKALRVWFNCGDTLTAEVDSWWVGGGYGLDIIPTTNGIGYTGQPYIYRYRYRSSKTGAVSSLSPPSYYGDVPIRNSIEVFPNASTDPQVDFIDVVRIGGTVNDAFRYVGSIPNTTGAFLTDTTEDSVLLNAAVFPEDDYVPFPVDDLPRSGTVTCSGNSVRWVSGDKFNPQWIPGALIIIDTITYQIASVINDQFLFTVSSVGAKTGVTYQIPNPTIMGTPLPVMWGPFHGQLFGTGDPNNPGIVYFTKPDNPDAASDAGFVEVTSPSEPMMNGVIYEDSVIVFSTERAYRLQPSQNNANGYTPMALATGRGLYSKWGLCVGPKIWFVGRDGIYEYAADGGAISITNDDLYPLFPHDSQPGQSFTTGAYTIVAPDYTQLNWLRLNYCNNWLYFDYKGLDGNFYTLAYNTLSRFWLPYTYTPGATLHVTEEGYGINSTLIGFANGTAGFMGGYSDGASTVSCVTSTPSEDLGDTRATKQFGDLTLDADAEQTITLQVNYDNYTVQVTPTPSTDAISGRNYLIYDLESGLGDLKRNIALVTSWTSVSGNPTILYEWQPSWLVKPEFTKLRATDWDSTDYGGNKFVQGVRITCDTQNTPRTIKIQKDGGVDSGVTITVQANGQVTLPFSWQPFEAHNLRLLPTDTSGQWRIMQVEWIYEPAPETAAIWKTQFTTHDLEGFQHIREYYLQYKSGSGVVFTVTADGNVYNFNLPATDTKKAYLVSSPIKGKTFQYAFAGADDLQIYKLDCEVRVKSWGSTGPFTPAKPFGDLSRVIGGGARI